MGTRQNAHLCLSSSERNGSETEQQTADVGRLTLGFVPEERGPLSEKPSVSTSLPNPAAGLRPTGSEGVIVLFPSGSSHKMRAAEIKERLVTVFV
jgi:hypothetical protein